MSQQIRVTLYHDGSIGTQLSIPPPSLAIVNGITTSKSSITNQLHRKQEIEDFLNEIWSMFGTVLNVVYHKSYTSAIITYRNHTTAVFAFAALNDPIQFAVAMQSAIGANLQRAEYAKLLFQPDPATRSNSNGGGDSNAITMGRLPVRTCTPTWMD
jgi:hypothetical protein